MTAQTFRLELDLRTPAILQGHLTLESLLAAAVYEQTGLMRDEALAHVPIDSVQIGTFKLWSASSAFLDGAVQREFTEIVRRRSRDEMGPDFYTPNLRSRKTGPYFVEQGKGDFKALLNAYPTYKADRLVWYFNGDAEKCANMLASLMFIGKRRGQGYGEIGDVRFRPVDENAVLDANGIVRRPIPVELLNQIAGAAPIDKQTVRLVVAQHPLFAHAPVPCALPPSNQLNQVQALVDDEEEQFFD